MKAERGPWEMRVGDIRKLEQARSMLAAIAGDERRTQK
jgi:hypothetical protein